MLYKGSPIYRICRLLNSIDFCFDHISGDIKEYAVVTFTVTFVPVVDYLREAFKNVLADFVC